MRYRLIPAVLCACGAFVLTTAAGESAALAATQPTAVTGPVANVHYTKASVFGDVNPNAAATHWYFQYGTSTSYGLATPSESAGFGTADVPVSAAIDGLRPGARYHYRVVATSADGTEVGADGAFTTPAAPPSVATGATSAVKDTTASFNAVVDPHGLDTVASFEFGISTGYGLKTSAVSAGDGSVGVAVSRPVAHLVPNTTYHLRVIATNAVGTIAGADRAFTTTGPAVGAAGAPSLIGYSSVTLNGTVNPDGHPTSWYFQYGTTAAYTARTAVRAAGDGQTAVAVSAPVTGLAPGTVYHFRLVMHSADGTVVEPDTAVSTLGPTLALAAPHVVFGRTMTLSGTIPTGAANNTVTIFAQRVSDASYLMIGTVLTDSTGAWTYTTRPSIKTSYKALWDNATSPPANLSVQPSVTLRGLPNRQFTTHVVAARSEFGRLVRLQRLVGGGWRTVAVARLDHTSKAVFAPQLAGRSARLRVMMTGFQAGVGYSTGSSRTQLFALHS
jgi:hypothetical protein